MTRPSFLAVCTLFLAMLPANAATPGSDVTVTVQARRAGGDAVASAYIALVPPWRPSSRPLVEQIAERGVATFRVPAGAYHVVAFAKGFAIASRGPIVVKPESTIVIELAPLRAVSGTVTDAKGTPIGGARVAGVHAAIPPPIGELSELAAAHGGSDWAATAGEDGRWKLNVTDAAVALLFSAPGHAGEWRIVPKAATSPIDVSLAVGATLTVKTDRTDPNLLVTLSREDDRNRDPLLRDMEPRLHSQWVRRDTVVWSSLPPGTYAVWAKYPDPRYFLQRAVELGRVTLRAGARVDMPLRLPPSRRPARAMAALFVPRLSRQDLGDELETFGLDATGTPRRVEHFAEAAAGGTVVHVNTDGVRPPLYATTADRLITTGSELTDAAQAADQPPLLAAAYPRADASFSLRLLEKEMQPPTHGMAVLRGCGDGYDLALPIEIRNTAGRFTAAAGCRDVILELDPFEPVILHRALPAGDVSLGEFALRTAASAAVHVVRGDRAEAVAGASVRAFITDPESRRAVMVAEAKTDDGGWATVAGLPAYAKLRVVADMPGGGASGSAAVTLEPRQRAVVDPLVIPSPATLIVDAKIDERFLARFPATTLVAVQVRPVDPDRVSDQKQQNTGTGTSVARFKDLQPGTWLVTGMLRVAGSHSPVDLGEVELAAGEERRLERTIEPNVFDGVVTSAGKPVAAKVTIRDGDRILSFATDANGVFRAMLQQPGIYPVAVARANAQTAPFPVGEIAFTDPARRIEIELPPAGRVTARVKNGGRPLAGAMVWISRRDASGAVEQLTNRGRATDATGETVFDDVAPGPWTFTVRQSEERRGAETTVTVEAGSSVIAELDVKPSPAIEGTIHDLGGTPLPRAYVDCLLLTSSGVTDRLSARTDSEGRFVISTLTPAPQPALCSGTGPMGTVDAFKATPGRVMNLVVPAATATLNVRNWRRAGRADTLWLVAPDGRVVSLAAAAAAIGGFDSMLSIPALAAGNWRVVRAGSLAQLRALSTGMGMSLPAIAEVRLRAGTAETVDLE